MSTTLSYQDDLRIPPMPRCGRLPEHPHPVAPPMQLAVAAVSGFVLAWVLARFVIG